MDDQFVYQRHPELEHYKAFQNHTKRIFRVSPSDLNIMFNKKNLRKPNNKGECRMSLNILKECGYNAGLT